MSSFLASLMSTNSSRQEHLVFLISAAELTGSTVSVKVTGVLLDNKKIGVLEERV